VAQSLKEDWFGGVEQSQSAVEVADHELEQHDSEGVDIRRRGDGLAGELLRRRVLERQRSTTELVE
jgi:hypothetical protein